MDEQKIFAGAVLGFEFEAYFNKPKKEIAKEIGILCKKKVQVGESYHTEGIDPSIWRVEPDFSLGLKGTEIITSPMPYQEAIACMFKILSYIRENGYTDEKCAFHANISFN